MDFVVLTQHVNRNTIGIQSVSIRHRRIHPTLLFIVKISSDQALVELQTKHNISRQDLFIQTKFTRYSRTKINQNLYPYDPSAPLAEQVRQSLATSLKNLHT